MMHPYPAVEGMDGAVGVIDRRGDERCSHGAVEIVPTVFENAVLIVTVIAGITQPIPVMPRSALVGGVQKLIGESLNEGPACLFKTDTPQSVSDILSVTDESEVIFKEILPVGIDFPSFSFGCEHQLLRTHMVSLCIELVIGHDSTGMGHEHIAEGFPSAAYIAVNRADATPLGCMMKLIGDVHRQFTSEPHGSELMMEEAMLHIDVIRHPRMGDAAFDLKIAVTTGEGYVTVNTYRDTRQGMTVSGEDHRSHTERRVLRLVDKRLDAGGEVKDIQPQMGVELIEITGAFGGILHPSGELHRKVIVPPAVRMHGLFINAGGDVSAERSGADITVGVAHQPERRIGAGRSDGTDTEVSPYRVLTGRYAVLDARRPPVPTQSTRLCAEAE